VGSKALDLALTRTKRSPGRGSSSVFRRAFAALSPMRSAGSRMTRRVAAPFPDAAPSASRTRICGTVICDRTSPRPDGAPKRSSQAGDLSVVTDEGAPGHAFSPPRVPAGGPLDLHPRAGEPSPPPEAEPLEDDGPHEIPDLPGGAVRGDQDRAARLTLGDLEK